LTAVLLVAVAAIITDQLRHVFPSTPNSLFFCAVVLSAWRGGFGPGVLASFLSSAASIFWLPPPSLSAPSVGGELPRFSVFLLASFFINWLCSRQQRAQAALRQARDELEQRVRERTRELTAANDGLRNEVVGRQRVENALRESQARLEEAQRVAHIGHWERDPAANQIIFSDEALHIFGLPSRERPLSVVELQQIIHPDDRVLQKQAMTEALQGRSRYDVEYRVVLPGGEVRFVHSLGDTTRDESNRPILVFGTLQDITRRKQAELLLNGQRRVLEMIAANAPLSESLTALVRLIEGHVPGILGSILLVDKQGTHLCHGAAPSLPAEYVAAIEDLPIGDQVGSCGTAAWCREPVFVEDIGSDPRWQDYRGLALRHGLRACWSSPIFDEQRRVVGTFAMYYREPALPKPEHLQIIETTAHLAAVAICRHHDQAGLQESEAKLKEAQRIARRWAN
jgi:PAS domain S-box-containing protein